MFRPLIIAILLGSSAAAQAQISGGPPIAYVKRLSNGDEIHLISDTGSERLMIYKAKSKVQITMLDLRPSGGEVAFTENHRTLKILAFDNLGRPAADNPRTIRTVSSPCSVESPDYHPNGTLLFVEGCGRDRAVRTVQKDADQADTTAVFSSAAVFRARWSRLGDVIYWLGPRPNASSSDPDYLYRFPGSGSQHDELGVITNWATFDVARVGEKVFWGDEQGFKMLDFSQGATTGDAVTLACPRGTRMSRSSDDTQMAFQSPWARGKGNYVMIGATNCGDPVALTGAGSWGSIDWRN